MLNYIKKFQRALSINLEKLDSLSKKNKLVWLIGNRGMLGSDIEQELKRHNIKYIATDKEIDIKNFYVLYNFVIGNDISWIINCAAYTDVEGAEDHYDDAFALNAFAVKNLAKIAKMIDAKLVHFSTDYVFNGSGKWDYTEHSITNPINMYGETKRVGEMFIEDDLKKYFILRLSWLYGNSFNKNFVDSMINLFNNSKKLHVNNQEGSPTYTVDVAELVCNIIKRNSRKYGIYHYSGEGKTTWYEFAVEIYQNYCVFDYFNKDIDIVGVSPNYFKTKAKRPKCSYMSKEKVKNTFNIQIPHWKESLVKYFCKRYDMGDK